MAISDTQKVDYLWKKIGYSATKTDTTANKDATNEALPSSLQIRGDTLLVQSSSIPGTIPSTTTSIVSVYRPDATLEMPQTAIGVNGPTQRGQLGSATAYRTWQTGLQNWISPEFGATYAVRVFLDTAGRTTSNTTGTEIYATASGEEWFFDYQSGVLNFSGNNLPSGISTKSVYISGARYTGEIGISNTVNTGAAAFAQANAAFTAANGAVAVNTTQNNSITAAFNTANAAFAAANNATDTYVRNHANAAFDTANSAVAVNETQNNSITAAFNTANAAYANANSYITYNEAVNVTQNNSIAAAFAAANSATATDTTQNNSITVALNTANAAFENSNSFIVLTQAVNLSQNNSIIAAFNTANAAFASANNIDGVNATQNNSITVALNTSNAAFAQSNATVGVDATQNNSITAAFNTANAAFAAANASTATNTTQNNSITVALDTANAAFTRANNSLNANTGGYVGGDINVNGIIRGLTVGGDEGGQIELGNAVTNTTLSGNVAIDIFQNRLRIFETTGLNRGVYIDLANDAISSVGTNILSSANTNITQNNSIAAAFLRANNSLDANNGGVITGNVSITKDLSVSGNLFVLGNTFSVNAGSLITNDTLFILGEGNYVSDVLDIGFASHYNDGTNAHSGLIRDAGSKEWHLFKGYTPEILANNNININDPSFEIDTLNANLHATYVTVKNIDILPYANGIYNTANAAFASANAINGVDVTQNNSITSAFIHANAAFLAANAATATDTTQNNSITVALNTANAAFTSANNIDGVNLTQNNSIIVALNTANAAYANANSYITYNQAVNVTQNNSIAAAFAAANSATATDTTQNNSITAAFNTANAAFVRANNSLDANTGGTVTGDVTFVGNVTSNSLITTGSNGSITGANAIFTNYVFAANGNVDLYIYTSRAYDKANAAFTSANNTDGINATQNNSIIVALDTANAAYANSNTYITYNQAVNITQNNSIIAAFNTANAATATNITQNNSITAAFIRANNSLDANNGGTIAGDIVITGNLSCNIVGGTF